MMSQKYMVVIHLRDNEIEIKHYHVDKVKNISKILKTYADYIVHIKYDGVNQEINYIKKEDIKEGFGNNNANSKNPIPVPLKSSC